MKTALLLFLILVIISLISCTTEEGDTINVKTDQPALPELQIDTVAGCLLVPGVPNPLRATAYYDYAAEQDWTNLVSWSVSDTTWATISAAGVLTPKRAGSGEVVVVSPESWIARRTFLVREIQSLHVAIADPMILREDSTLLSLSASLTGGYTRAVRAGLPVTWTSTSPGIASMSPDWTLHGLTTGQTAITASISGVTSYPVVLTVDSVLSLTVEESTTGPYLPMDSVIVTAYGHTLISGLVTMTDRVHWTNSDPVSFLQVGPGAFLPVTASIFHLSADLGGRISQTLGFDIWNITAVRIVPESYPDTLRLGDTLEFSALATVQGHGQPILTDRVEWTSSDNSVGDFVAPGVFVPRGVGTTHVQAHASLVSSNSVALLCNVPYVFVESFESYPIGPFSGGGDWETYTYGSTERIAISDVAAVGGKSLMIVDSSYSDYGHVEITGSPFTPVPQGKFSFQMRTNGSGLNVFLGSGDGYSYTAVELWMNYNEIYASDGGSSYYLTAYEPNVWYSFRVEFDCATDDYKVYVNDVLRGNNLNFYYSQTALDYIRFETSSSYISNQSYIDQIILDDH